MEQLARCRRAWEHGCRLEATNAARWMSTWKRQDAAAASSVLLRGLRRRLLLRERRRTWRASQHGWAGTGGNHGELHQSSCLHRGKGEASSGWAPCGVPADGERIILPPPPCGYTVM